MLKRNLLSLASLEALSKEDLIKHVLSLQERKENKRQKTQRKIDFSKFEKLHVAFRVAYDGAAYHGMATQQGISSHTTYKHEDIQNVTIEDVLLRALMKTSLIESVNACGWSRCGRTDAGVSAIGQIVSLWVRGRRLSDLSQDKQEYPPYACMLNGVLPKDVRILDWSLVSDNFDARFDCRWREYRYFFASGETLDISSMQEAARHLLGEHDFRNLACKDPSKPEDRQSYIRTILKAQIIPASGSSADVFAMWQLVIRGNAFLYHQVRCIMAVLILVGHKLEEPSIVAKLLDPSAFPRKPSYVMAPDTGLVLSEAGYDAGVLNWWCKDKSLIRDAWFERWEQCEQRSLLARYAIDVFGLETKIHAPPHHPFTK